MKIKSFETFNEKSEQWIKDAIKKPGALKKSMGKEEETLTKKEIDAEIEKLKAKDKDKEKEGIQLGKKDAKTLRRLRLAKTLMGLKKESHQEIENYMFFGNLKTIKRLVDELLEMDEQEIDAILKEHDWASDHVSVATENIEQVFDFLLGYEEHEEHEVEEHEEEHGEKEHGHEVEEHEEEKADELEIKNFDSFMK